MEATLSGAPYAPTLPAAAPRASAATAWTFAVTVFTGAFLLFQVQPLIGKYVLPWFGGGPAVWTTCMLFFQVLLLGGYAYAHFLTSRFATRTQAVVHMVVLAAALCTLPIWPSERFKPVGVQVPVKQILALLIATIGLPYFALSATGPLMQAWFGKTARGVSPYRLYALSNVGSMLALLSFPFVFEPNMTRRSQAILWSIGLAVFTVLCGACARLLWRNAEPAGEPDRSPIPFAGVQSDSASGPPPLPAFAQTREDFVPTTPLRVALWILLPAAASSLLLAVTNKLCQDVAVVPFLWILPLALYLLTFIVAFDAARWYFRPLFAVLLGWAAYHFIDTILKPGIEDVEIKVQIFFYLAVLFGFCMMCHGEVVRLKPRPERLTGFYLSISFGGALGGLFVSVVAPKIFTDFYELHISLVACAVLISLAVATDYWFWRSLLGRSQVSPLVRTATYVFPLLIAATWWFATRVYRDYERLADHNDSSLVESRRNFYGVLRVTDEPFTMGTVRRLQHGVIIHGAQYHDPTLRDEPVTYYTRTSGLGRAMSVLEARPHLDLAVVGLGTGTMAAYARESDSIRFFEINPAVEDIATRLFWFFGDCKSKDKRIVMGDARLSLEKPEDDRKYDLLVLDAFSSDAIPVHLLTKEAFDIYNQRLKPNAIIAVHISNRHLDLEPVVDKIAQKQGYSSAWVDDPGDDEDDMKDLTEWILLSRDAQLLADPTISSFSKPPSGKSKSIRLWTDDDTNLFQILRNDSSAESFWEAIEPFIPFMNKSKTKVAGASRSPTSSRDDD